MNYLIGNVTKPINPRSDDNSYVDVDGMYKSQIRAISGGNEVFTGYVPEDFQINLANNWDPIGGLGDAIPGLSGVTNAVDGASKRLLGGVQPLKYLSPQTWSGPSYLTISLPFELHNWTSAESNVLSPMLSMMKLVTPSTDPVGRLIVPGPSPVKTAIESYTASEGGDADYSSLISGKIFACSVGTFFEMSPCIITDVTAAMDGQFEHSTGLPMSVSLNVQVQSYYPVSREDIDAWFFASEYGLEEQDS